MKSIALAILLITPAFAAGFDAQGFGDSLNGWKRNNTATYDFADASYRTHKPTVTTTPGGGIFISTQVDTFSGGGKAAVSHISAAFSRSGILESAQLRTTVNGKVIDTGLVLRQEDPAPPAEGEIARPFNGTTTLINDLMTRYDAETKRVTEPKDGEKRDLISRITGADSRNANVAAGLRHNLNLILQHTHR